MADIPGVPLNERGAPTEVFGELTIERRVLLTPRRTIAIPNIATISVTTLAPEPVPLLWGFGATCIVGGFGMLIAAGANGGPPAVGLLAVLLFLAGVAVFAQIGRTATESKTHVLGVATSDGTRTLFSSPSRETLDKVRRILSDKINAHDETSTYTINFANGTIESLNVASVGSLQAGAIVQGEHNQVIAGSAQARIGTADTTHNTSYHTTHNATHNATHTATHNTAHITTVSHSPAAQVGTGHVQHGTHVELVHIDYSSALPQIEGMLRHYAHRPDARPIEERLTELEQLMRAGTPTPHQKSRLRDLVVDISTILQASPQWVEFFRSIARMAGF